MDGLQQSSRKSSTRHMNEWLQERLGRQNYGENWDYPMRLFTVIGKNIWKFCKLGNDFTITYIENNIRGGITYGKHA